MKVLLLRDVYKLGRAGDVKKVADGYGRNYLIPQKLALLATPGTLKQADRIRQSGLAERARLNQEMTAVAERLRGLNLTFVARAGETGKLYGSITTGDITEAIERDTGVHVDRRHVAHQPLRELGTHSIPIRLTVDLVPEVTVVVTREGEETGAASVEQALPVAEEPPQPSS